MAFIYQYYVEGENEKKLVEVLSKEFNFIKAGKVEVLNVVEKPIKNSKNKKSYDGISRSEKIRRDKNRSRKSK